MSKQVGSGFVSDELSPPDDKAWDLVVIGGGTAGLVGAKTAAGFGASVLLVEMDRTGGDCLWTGCVPSKALLAAAHSVANGREAKTRGIHFTAPTVAFDEVMAYVHQSIETIQPADSVESLRRSNVKVVHGRAAFSGRQVISIDGSETRFRQALIATGSSPDELGIDGLDKVPHYTSDTIWTITQLPERLVVIGGGSIGVELGQAFAELGSSVVVVQRSNRLLPREDADAAEEIAKALRQSGVDIRTNTTVDRFTTIDGVNTAQLSDGSQVACDAVLLAAGRRSATDALDLERCGVTRDSHGYITVDEHLRTTNARIWAAGDVTGAPQFTHTAGVHASAAASNAILGLRRRGDIVNQPRVTYTQPELAAFGVTMALAEERGLHVQTVEHSEVDRAVVESRPSGFSRAIFDGRGRIVGATIVGPRAGESLAELVLAAVNGLKAKDLAGTTHAYPTYADGPWKAAISEVRVGLQAGPVAKAIGIASGVRRRWVDLSIRLGR